MIKTVSLDAAQVQHLIRGAIAAGDAGPLVHRLDGVLLVTQGCSCGEVAQWFGVSRRSVERWLQAVCAAGNTGLLYRQRQRHSGRRSSIDRSRLQRICHELLQSPSMLGYPEKKWSGKRLALHLSRGYGITLSVRSCQRLIARCHALGSSDAP